MFLSVHLRFKFFNKGVRYAHIKIPARTFHSFVLFVHKNWYTLATFRVHTPKKNNKKISEELELVSGVVFTKV